MRINTTVMPGSEYFMVRKKCRKGEGVMNLKSVVNTNGVRKP